jgi:hypothetical protein
MIKMIRLEKVNEVKMIAQFDAVDKFLIAMGIDSSKLTTMEVSTLRYVMLKAIENESNLAVSDFMYNNDYLGRSRIVNKNSYISV